ncbi:MAG: energy transducer TonB [Steroidobacteraceae bacterium]
MNVNANLSAANDAASFPHASSPPQRRVIALTDDPALSQALEMLATLDVAVVQVANRDSLVEEILRGDPAIAIVDAAFVDRKIDTLVDKLADQFPDLRIIVAGHSLEQNVLATRIAQGIVFRFLHKPASAQRLKLFVDAANRPNENTRTLPILTAVPDSLRETARPAAAAGPEGPRRGPGGLPLPVIAGAAVAVVAVGAWLLFRGDDTPKAASTPAATAPATADVEALVRSADQAFAAQKFAGRDGDSAAELYQRALQASPQEARARSGLTRSFDFALRNAEAAFNEGRYAEVETAVAALQALSPGNSRLAFLSTQLNRERERSAADEKSRLTVEARQDRLRGLLTQANDRLRRGMLVTADRQGAIDSLLAAQDLAPTDGDVRSLRERVGTRLVENATQRLDAGDAQSARALIDAAAGIGVDGGTLNRLRTHADEVSRTAGAPRETRTPVADSAPAATPAAPPVAVVQTPMPAPAAPVSATPAPAPAAATRPAGPRLYATSELTLLKKVEFEYPKRALDSATSGWVDVEFTISIDGSVKNVVVLNSEPRNLFDGPAQQGLKRWRYRPVVENGDVVEARTRMRLRFTPQDR